MVLGGLAALGLLARRHALEARNHSVEMVADLAAAAELAKARHLELKDMLAEFSRLGVGSVAVNELHLDDLIDSGQLFRDLGVLGLIEMGIFAGMLLLGFIYVWKKGALEWE